MSPKHHHDNDDDSVLSDHHDTSERSPSEPDTDEAIDDFKRVKSKNTSKRKIRATAPSNFGATLQSLLNTDAPTTLPLSLQPSIVQRHGHEKLEKRAKKALQMKKKEEEAKGRIRDVIGGWGAESERGLRKVAQRGGVYLRCSQLVYFAHNFLSREIVQCCSADAYSSSSSRRGSKSRSWFGKTYVSCPII